MSKKTFLEKLANAKKDRGKEKIKKISAQEKSDSSEAEENMEGQLTLDVYQTLDNIVIKSTIAGVKAEDIDISINNDMITIKGTRKNEDKVKPEDYYYQECYWGPFSRSVILPIDIETDKIGAELKNGILTITLPKASKAKVKNIAVTEIK